MSDEIEARKAQLEAEMKLLDAHAKYDAATSAFREHATAANKTRFKKAKQAFVDLRQEQRRAEGRPETSGAGTVKAGG